MSGTDTATPRVAHITNYEPVTDPRPLTDEEIADGDPDDNEPGQRPYYAIKRENGYVGIHSNSDRHTKSPKVRVLYVTGDGTRSFTLMHAATETHQLHHGWTSIAVRQPDAGFPTANRSIHRFRDLATQLHGIGGDTDD
jgi:hypothetical protein